MESCFLTIDYIIKKPESAGTLTGPPETDKPHQLRNLAFTTTGEAEAMY